MQTEKVSKSATDKSRRLQERSIVTRNKLLDAALDAFSEHGFEGTSTRAIADRANVHHPLITYHFDNKLTLWKSAVDRAFAPILSEFAATVANSTERPAAEQMKSLIKAYVVFSASHPQLHRVIVHESAHPNERLDWLTKKYLQPLYLQGREIILQGQSAGIVIAGDPSLIYNMLRLGGSALFAVSHEIKQTTGLVMYDAAVVEDLVDTLAACFIPSFR